MKGDFMDDKVISVIRRVLAGVNAIFAFIYLYRVFFVETNDYYPIGILVFLLGSFYMMNSAYKQGEEGKKENLGEDFNKTLVLTGFVVQAVAIVIAVLYLVRS